MIIKQAIGQRNITNTSDRNEIPAKLTQYWLSLLSQEEESLEPADRESIVDWLLGEYFNRTIHQTSDSSIDSQAKLWEIYFQALNYRYRILQTRYLGVNPHKAYRNLILRFSSIPIIRHKLQAWLERTREKNRLILEVLEEVIQEMLERDRYIQKQIDFIARCTDNSILRNSLLLTTVEEYCLRPIRDRPLLCYRIVNFMVERNRGGITHIPKNKKLHFISPNAFPKNTDLLLDFFDYQAILEYSETNKNIEQNRLRIKVIQEFEGYLAEKVGILEVKWLRLYLQDFSQKASAKVLNLPIGQVYRLREKVAYHAVNFAIKEQPELIAEWLEISLQEHNFGLTYQQWQQYWQLLTPTQRELVEKVKQGRTLKEICKNHNLKIARVTAEWSKVYFAAQQFRNH